MKVILSAANPLYTKMPFEVALKELDAAIKKMAASVKAAPLNPVLIKQVVALSRYLNTARVRAKDSQTGDVRYDVKVLDKIADKMKAVKPVGKSVAVKNATLKGILNKEAEWIAADILRLPHYGPVKYSQILRGITERLQLLVLVAQGKYEKAKHILENTPIKAAHELQTWVERMSEYEEQP